MSLVRDLTPINLITEKAKFFNDFSYNLRFEYKQLIIRNQLTKYGLPKTAYLGLAQEIVDRAFYNRTEVDIRNLEGPTIDLEKAKELTQRYLEESCLQNIINTTWSEDFVSKASIYRNQLKFRLPIDYHQQEFLATLDHEIGTHALRHINYTKQAFFNKKRRFGFSEYLFTEEGLASINGLINKNFKYAYKEALNYIMVDYAQRHSFAETFRYISKYIHNKERAWGFVVKYKKGLYDTSKPGGFTKDLVYFEGLIEISNYLKNHNYDPSHLYIGKISWQDEKKAWQMNPNYQLILPSFLQNKELYAKKIAQIIETNKL